MKREIRTNLEYMADAAYWRTAMTPKPTSTIC